MTDSPVSYPKVEMQPPLDQGESSKAGAEKAVTQGEAQVEAEPKKDIHRFGVQVTDLSPKATEHILREFFEFSGKITDVQLYMPPEGGHAAKIYFEKEEEAETATLLTGAIILDEQVVISSLFEGSAPPVMGKKAVDVISQMLSQGYLFGKTTLDKIGEFDKKMGLSESVKQNIAKAKEKLEGLDGKLQIRSRTSSFLKSVQGKLNEADSKFKISEKFNSTSQKVSENQNIKKATKGMKYGFSTISANFSKISNATSSKIKQQLGKPETNSTS
ncbi:RRM domain-containing protein [Chloropicon primus]|nr:RRM domain-containing protein [Chloropicon primus]